MKKVDKINHPTIKTKKTVKNREASKWVDDYMNLETLSRAPMTEAGLERLAFDLIKWAKHNNDALNISSFYLDRGIGCGTYYRWMNSFDVLKTAHETALAYIGNRRDVGTMNRTFAETNIAKMKQMFYDPVYKECMEAAAKMKEEQDKNNNKVTVVLESFPNSSMVPSRKTADEKE